jgi:glutamate synthase (ferredoxin)
LQIIDAIEHEKEVSKTIQIYNVDRAVCGRVAGVIAKKYGDTGFAGQLNLTYVFYLNISIFLFFKDYSTCQQ